MLVALGPSAELHRGIHGSLTASPPVGVRYVDLLHRHRFLLPRAAGPERRDPFAQPSVLERVRYEVPPAGAGLTGVHSSRLPVDGGVPFVVDTDDLVLTLLYGRPLVRGGRALPPSDHPVVRRRVLLMLAAYLDDACVGVLFRTRRALDEALDLTLDVAGGAAHDRLEERSEVVRPAVPPGPKPAPARPDHCRPVHVAFVGDGWEDKGGPEAAQVMAELVRCRGKEELRLSWVGPCPEPWRGRLGAATVHDRLPREDVLSLLADADVLLAPSRFESFGMVLIEALAHGVVPVTSSGPGMEHVTELLPPGLGMLLVPTDLPLHERVSRLLGSVETLLDRPDLLLSMQRAAWDWAATGPLSLSTRDDALTTRYAAMSDLVGSAPPVVEPRRGEVWCGLSSEELSEGYRTLRAGGRRVRVTEVGPSIRST
ncbi:glycosyltransferase [Ornithinimicrobium avium]|uniref:glycosyltransferase n=1 Tax=Ornithinimicrobium avium TaxID=2283195 RepID=UPI0013B3995E|nr:glycosyltransferase [Ornithinimicrobium avium]